MGKFVTENLLRLRPGSRLREFNREEDYWTKKSSEERGLSVSDDSQFDFSPHAKHSAKILEKLMQIGTG
jgi:hypothetical protein